MDGAGLRDFSATIDAVYDAALAPKRWPHALERIAHLHRSDKALLFTATQSPAQGGFTFPFGISESALLEWSGRYLQHDLWTQRGIALDLPAGRAVTDTDLVPDQELLDSTFYREFLSPLGIGRLCTGRVFDKGDERLPGTTCSIYGTRENAFADKNRVLHSLTLGHLSRSLGTMSRLRDAELSIASTLAALDRLPGCVFLLGARGQVIFSNLAANRVLQGGDGIAMRAGNSTTDALGWLHAARPSVQAELVREIRKALCPQPARAQYLANALRLPRPSGRAPLVLQISPLAEQSALATADRQAFAIVFVSDPEAQVRVDPVLGKQIYALTPAESRLANNLLGGENLREIAGRTAVSELTLRKQLQALFGKTRTRRQSELLKLLMSFATPHA